MNLLYYTLAAIVFFLITIILFEKRNIWSTIVSSLGIAGVVNANFFHSGNYPIDVFGLNFGVDAIIYTLFIYTIILNFFYFGKKSAIIYTFSGAAAVFLAGVIELIAVAFSSGHSIEAWAEFGGFAISALATIAAGVCAVLLIDFLKKKFKIHNMFLIIIGIVLATIVNTLIYYSLTPLILKHEFDIILILTSFIGKFISLACACGSYGLIILIERCIKKKEQKNDKNNNTETTK